MLNLILKDNQKVIYVVNYDQFIAEKLKNSRLKDIFKSFY